MQSVLRKIGHTKYFHFFKILIYVDLRDMIR